MFTKLWKYLILAFCTTSGIACSHHDSSTCSGTVAPPNPNPSCTCQH
jgi:hypothetical protein